MHTASLREGYGWQARTENDAKTVRRSLAANNRSLSLLHPRIGFFSSKFDVVPKADSRYSSFMKYVYLIRSESHPQQSDIGITADLKKRLIVQ